MKNKLKVASYITDIVARLQEEGYETYIVGGAIRDLMLKRIPIFLQDCAATNLVCNRIKR